MDRLIGMSFGPYKILDKISEGGMGVVYRGLQESLNRPVAIKILRGELAQDEQFVARFRREALSIAKLRHPNIVDVYDFGLAHGLYYIVMEYVDGGSLKELIQRGALPVAQAVSIAAQMADALDYAHRQGMVHRDVKPGNILLTHEGHPMLTDFGIARALDTDTRLTRTGTSIGTPEYMAPEQVQGEVTDGRTDIYALGIVLYEMLVGRVPFYANTPMATLYKQVNEVLPPLRQVVPGIPAWLEAVVSRALAKQPDARYPRASDLATALRQGAQSGVAEPARPAVGAVPRPDRQRRREPPLRPASIERPAKRRGPSAPVVALLVTVILLLVALLAGGTYLLVGNQGQRPATEGSPTPAVAAIVSSPTLLPTVTEMPALPTVTPTTFVAGSAAPPSPTPPPAATMTWTPVVVTAAAGGAGNTPGATAQPVVASEVPPSPLPPTPLPSKTPMAVASPAAPPAPAGEPGAIADMETFGTWKRGNESNGTLTQSSAQVHQGSYAGKLDYNFGTSGNDYVVFSQPHPIGGQPTSLSAWVFGDESGHFLNAWIKDKAGQVWQVPLGRVTHTGWQQMTGLIDVNQEWPWTHISGPDNGRVDYPISFQALVLDDNPDRLTGSGTIYLDDLRAGTAAGSPGEGAPAATAAPQPAVQPTGAAPASVPGRIVFSAGGALHIVRAATGQDTIPPIANMRQPDFRRDGQQVIAKGYQGDKTSLWTINANNGAFMRQQSGFTDDFQPFWSPGGDRFVYASFHHGLGQYQMLYIQKTDDRSSRPEIPVLYGSTQIRGTFPVWMENDWLAFTACDYWPNDQGQIGGSNCGIYRMPSWGGQPARVKPGGLDMRATDEQSGQLLLMSPESGNWEVYLMPAQGGAERNLSNSPGSNDGLGTFSPDGKLVAFVSNRGGSWAIWLVRTDGTGLTKLFNLPAAPSVNWTEEQVSWGP